MNFLFTFSSLSGCLFYCISFSHSKSPIFAPPRQLQGVGPHERGRHLLGTRRIARAVSLRSRQCCARVHCTIVGYVVPDGNVDNNRIIMATMNSEYFQLSFILHPKNQHKNPLSIISDLFPLYFCENNMNNSGSLITFFAYSLVRPIDLISFSAPASVNFSAAIEATARPLDADVIASTAKFYLQVAYCSPHRHTHAPLR
jgi:hypothetical protein